MIEPADSAQRLAALHPGHSFVVQAPAGSGKTGLLVRRYLTLLAQVSAPEEILAITFTRKATAEMRERILSALALAQTAVAPGNNDREVFDLGVLALKNDQRHQWHLLANPNRLRVQTIDAFCSELVRRMPWSARFGAAPVIVEDQKIEAIYKEAAKRTLDHLESDGADSDSCANVIKLLDGHYGNALALLSKMLQKRDRWMRSLEINSRKNFELMWQQVIEDQLNNVACAIPEKLKPEIAFLLRFAASNPYEKGPNETLAACGDTESFPDPGIEFLTQWRGIAALLLTFQKGRQQARKRVDVKIGFPPDFKAEKDRMKSVLEFLDRDPGIAQALSLVPALPDHRFSDRQWQALDSLIKLLPIAAAELKLLFKETNQADYIEITQRAEMALGDEDSPTDLALSFDHQIKHLLMDEVQDTSLAQIELLKKLTFGWQHDDGRTLFFVGDPMQSIYRFREAEVANFLDIQESGIGEIRPEALTLQCNFRSGDSLIEWYNRVFSEIFPARDDVINSAVSYSPSVPVTEHSGPNGVNIHAELDGSYESEAEIICGQVNAELKQDPGAQIGILGRNRKHLVSIARALRNHEIQFQAIELESLAQRPAIQDLMALTRALIQLGDRIAWLSILRAPWCGMSLKDLSMLAADDHNSTILELVGNASLTSRLSQDGCKRLSRVLDAMEAALSQRGRISLRKNVEAAWLSLGGPACVEHTDLGDCESYLEMLEFLEQDHQVITSTILTDAVTRLWSRTDGKSQVQLLTIHKSKGLEFDIVFLPQLHRPTRALDRDLLRWTRLPKQLLIAVLPHSDAKDDKFYHYLGDLEKLRQHNELHRLLYVACTRARRKLHLCMSISLDKKNQPNQPNPNSMLGLIWPALHHEILENLQVTSSETQHRENTLPLTNIRRLPSGWSIPEIPPGISPAHITAGETSDEPDQIEFSWAGEIARVAGIAIHKLLQKIDGKNWNEWKQTGSDVLVARCRNTLLEHGLSGGRIDQAETSIRRAVDNMKSDPKADWIFSGEHTGIRTEWPLTASLGDSFSSIVIDRSFIDQSGIRWIVDFKSSRHEGEDQQWFLENEKQRYEAQMELYASIVGKLDQWDIRLGLYFPLLKGWREWSPGD